MRASFALKLATAAAVALSLVAPALAGVAGQNTILYGVSYYHDHNHTFEISTSTLLAQLHLYL